MPAIEPASLPAPASDRGRRPYSERKKQILAEAEQHADERMAWMERHRFYYDEDWSYMRFLVPEGKRVLDLGCGTGELLNALKPAEGVGIDFSRAMIDNARRTHSHLTFLHGDVEELDDIAGLGGPFDVIVLSDALGSLDDCLQTLRSLHRYCAPHTRIIVSYPAWFWEPLFKLYSWFSGRRARPQNWLSSEDIANLFYLADFDVIKREWRMLSTFRMFGLGHAINRFVATLPLLRTLCLQNYVIARPQTKPLPELPSVSIVVPCRNERGNIEAAVRRIPQFAPKLEIIFVEGGSKDGTWEKVHEMIAANPQADIKAFKQTGKGKGDAVRKGFAEASGDILMILDADLTMPPEDLPKFYDALVSGKGEFINGSRLVYPLEKDAMRFLNLCANYSFALAFTYLLNQRHTDTLCGTKVLTRNDYNEIIRNRGYFGDFDPFGDFDLLFGASKLNLKTAEVPIRYAAREYGETQISRFRHGLLLLRMVMFAYRKLKAL
ncbi:MAG: glycosyltransferase [Xanthobacteraceae bacterium]|nr:glycosyltransferase [Xanthobacteraceae bacterium]